jgi:hypothetical protein
VDQRGRAGAGFEEEAQPQPHAEPGTMEGGADGGRGSARWSSVIGALLRIPMVVCLCWSTVVRNG